MPRNSHSLTSSGGGLEGSQGGYPKNSRVEDNDFSHNIHRRDGVCIYGLFHKTGCSFGLDPHHIIFKGEGGGDDKQNGIGLCRKHHDMAQRHIITARELQAMLARFYGYEYEGIKPWSSQEFGGKL